LFRRLALCLSWGEEKKRGPCNAWAAFLRVVRLIVKLRPGRVEHETRNGVPPASARGGSTKAKNGESAIGT